VEWSEELAGGLVQAAPDAILVLDAGRIVLVNDRAEQMFGWPREELLGRHAEVLLSEPALTAYRELLPPVAGARPSGPAEMPSARSRAVAGRSDGTISVTARHRDGTEFPAEASLATVDTPQGRVTVAVVRDCTERHRAEAEQDRLRREAQAHRQQRLESLGRLAGGIAHDFNNMLGVIVNYATFVIEEASAPEPDLETIAADAAQVVEAGRRATDLTHQLLAFARREVVRPRPLDLNATIEAQAGTLRAAAGDRVTLTLRPGPGLPPVISDPGQIEQLLVNLVVNARQAMHGGGELVIDTAAHRLPAGDAELAPGEYVRLRVCDSGEGMTPEVAERAFEPFFTTRGSAEGPGLGLATVYGIVTQAGGSVAISSAPGLGTTVTVLLPAGEHTEPTPERPEPAPAGTGHGETLLVVEDEAALREVACRILSGAGYHVLAADGGPQALELAAGYDGVIDLLVSDVVMPGMLGKELAERLVGSRPGTRVLYMSGYAQPVLASQGTLDPGVALLEKPFTATDLLTAVRDRLDG
jgi:two-component system cell cycle sensor histidine kinase/response regulator CckA